MRTWKYHYVISKNNSPQKFKETCALIDKSIIYVEKKKVVIDVDGSAIQMYVTSNGKVVIIDDYDVGTVYVNSDIKLSFLDIDNVAEEIYEKDAVMA